MILIHLLTLYKNTNSYEIIRKITNKEPQIHFDPVLIYDFEKEERERVIKEILATDYQKIKTDMLNQLDEYLK